MRLRTKAIIALTVTLLVAVLCAGGAYYYYYVLPYVQVENEYQEGIRLYKSGSYEESIRHFSATLQHPPALLPAEKRAHVAEVLGLIGAKLWETMNGVTVVMLASDRFVHGPPASSQVVSVLNTSLRDQEATVRRAAVRALAMTGVMTAARPLAGSLKDRDVSVRREAVFALATLYKMAGLGYRNSYPPTLRTRIDAAEAAARQALAAALKDGDPQVRERAAIAFGKIGEKDEHRPGPRADALLREAIKDDSIAVRLYAYWALHRFLRHSRVEPQRKALEAEAVELLTEALEHEDWTVRYKAAHVALTIHNKGIVEPLHRALKDHFQPVRLAAARALGEIEDATSIEPLVAALGDEDAAVRYRAAEALAAIGQRAVDALEDGSKAADSRVRLGAALALGMIQCDLAAQTLNKPADRQLLADALQTEDDAGRQSAARLAGMLADKTLVGPLVAALEDKQSNVRYRAAEALGKIGDSAAVGALIEALGDPYQPVRVRAAEALGEIKDPQAVEPLIEMMREEDEASRYFASNALAKIGAPAVPALVANLGDQGPHWGGWTILSGELVGRPGVMGYRCANEYPIPLGKIGAPSVEPLIEAMQDDDLVARNAALLALAIVWAKNPYREPSIEDGRIQVFTDEYSVMQGNRIRAFDRGGVWVPTEPFKPLPGILGIRVRRRAGTFFPKPPRPVPKIPDDTTAAAVDAVMEVLEDACRRDDKYGRAQDVQDAAWLVLGNFGGPLVVDRLLQRLTKPVNPRVGKSFGRALARIPDKEDVPRLIEALDDRRVIYAYTEEGRLTRVRDWAVEALGRIGDPRAIEPLEEALNDEEEDEDFRQRVTKALKMIKAEKKTPYQRWLEIQRVVPVP
jgi:HEAT repeat protein